MRCGEGERTARVGCVMQRTIGILEIHEGSKFVDEDEDEDGGMLFELERGIALILSCISLDCSLLRGVYPGPLCSI